MSGLGAQYTTTTPAFRLTTPPDAGYTLAATDPSAAGNRPTVAMLQAETQDIRFTIDGSVPTSSYGMILHAGDAPLLFAAPLVDLRFIRSASGAILNVTYYPNLQAALQTMALTANDVAIALGYAPLQVVVAGARVHVDNTNPIQPIISADAASTDKASILAALGLDNWVTTATDITITVGAKEVTLPLETP